jgi:hypothetical protein
VPATPHLGSATEQHHRPCHADAVDGIVLLLDGIVLLLDGIVLLLDGIALLLDGIALLLDGIALLLDGIALLLDGIALLLEHRAVARRHRAPLAQPTKSPGSPPRIGDADQLASKPALKAGGEARRRRSQASNI